MSAAADEAGSGTAKRRRPVALASEAAIRVGPVLVDPPSRRVIHDDGREAVVDPRSMKVLVALLRFPGTVFSRDELFDCCWERRFVTDDAVDRAILRLRRAIAPVVDSAIVVETVTKVGHRAVLTSADAGLREGSPPPPLVQAERLPGRAGRLRDIAVPAALAIASMLLATLLWSASPRYETIRTPSVGILPFAAAADGDQSLALGLGDQVRSDLSSRSDLQLVIVDPRAASPVNDAAAAALGRGLDLSYVIGGRLSRRGSDLHISAWLVETASGRRIWGEAVTSPLAALGQTQERLGARLASALGLQLTPSLRGTEASGEVQALYLSARALMRSRRIEQTQAAIQLLRDAASRDPDFAPVHARLGLALVLGSPRGDLDAVAAARAEALPHLRKALRLAPGLAEAHAAMGLAHGFASPAGMAHLRRAAELDPNDPEIQMWSGHVFGSELDFEGQLAAYRRANRLDPLWRTSVMTLVEAATDLGRIDVAEAAAGRFSRTVGEAGNEALAVLALGRNDLSEAYRARQALARVNGMEDEARWSIGRILDDVGLFEAADRYSGPSGEWRDVRAGRTIDPAEIIAAHGRDTELSVQATFLPAAIKRLVVVGRGSELAPLYDRLGGLLRVSRSGSPAPRTLLLDGPTVAIVLRQAGRRQEADRILVAAAGQAEEMLRRGAVPGSHLAGAAAVYGAMDRREAALALLERAVEAGWIYRGPESLRDIAEEPAFASLRGVPRFEVLRMRIRGHLERERREILELLARSPSD